jgi:hypothetical protein
MCCCSEKTLVCRFVIREDLSLATADKLLADIKDALDWLGKQGVWGGTQHASLQLVNMAKSNGDTL